MKNKFKFNLSFLDRFKKKRSDDQDTHVEENQAQAPVEDLNYSDENPEDFAEKTLSNFSLKKFHEEDQYSKMPEYLEQPQVQTHESQEEDEEEKEEEEEDAHDFQEMQNPLAKEAADDELPEQPKVAKHFSFKFPKFNFDREQTKNRIRAKLENSAIKSIERLSWNDIVLRLFSPYSRGKIHGVFVIILVVTVTYLTGKGIALFFSRQPPTVAVKSNIQIPIEKPDTTVSDVNKITSTNLFNVKESDKAGSQKAKVDISTIICLDADKPTSEPVKLMDTIVLQDSVKSVASVQVRGASELLNVREGEQLTSSIEVAKINRMKIILKNLDTGDCEYVAGQEDEAPSMPSLTIFSPQKGKALFKSSHPSIKNVGNNFTIKRSFRDQMINNISEVLTQAKAVPMTNPDGSLAFKMTEVVPGSVYSQLDIQNDDVITSINGKKIENLNELTSLLGRIREIDHFEIGLKRNGMSETKEYDFKN